MTKSSILWALLSFTILAIGCYLVLRDVALLLVWDYRENLASPVFSFVRSQPGFTSVILSLLFHILLIVIEPPLGKRILTRILCPLFALVVAWLVIGVRADIVHDVHKGLQNRQQQIER